MEGENLQELVKKQAETIRFLEARTAELEAIIARLQKNSGNSSKPPSFDIVKAKPAIAKEIGGQPGHKKHERTPFLPEQVDQVIDATLEARPECGGVLHECEEIVVKRQIEAVEKPFIVKEYRCHTYTCSGCQSKHTAAAPKETGSGLFSTGLTASAAYLKRVDFTPLDRDC